MSFSMDPEEHAKWVARRNSERKLASRHSRKRIVRKLPQIIIVERPKRPSPVSLLRRVINARKRLVYIGLLGATLGLYIHEVEAERLQHEVQTVQQTVEEAREFYLGA